MAPSRHDGKLLNGTLGNKQTKHIMANVVENVCGVCLYLFWQNKQNMKYGVNTMYAGANTEMYCFQTFAFHIEIFHIPYDSHFSCCDENDVCLSNYYHRQQ